MSEVDIQAVENGFSNYIFLNKYSIYPRIYQIIWELDNYRNGDNPSGHSIGQRLVYFNAAMYIIKNNFVLGVGTGDVQQEFNNYYKLSDDPLKLESRRRAHNQFLTFFIAFGIVGFIISIIALFLPVFLEKRWSDYLFLCFAIIAFLSMLNEDTLETQTGVSFFMVFYSLFLFGRNKPIPQNRNEP
jgi:O-antigen ligase